MGKPRWTEAVNIVVVGAGVAGLATALELRKAGCSVRVYAGTDAQTQASWAAGGMLMPILPWTQTPMAEALAQRAVRLYPEWVQDIQRRSGLSVEFRRDGALFFDIEHEAIASDWSRRQGRRLALLSAAELARQETWARPAPALLLPDVAQVRNPALLKALRASLLSLGVHVEDQAANGLISVGGWIRGVDTALGPVEADAVVVAAGAWSSHLAHDLPWPAIAPMRGQMLLFELPMSETPKACLLGRGHYLIPRADGRVLCGSTVEAVGFDRSTTAEAQASLQAAAAWLCPALANQTPKAHWAGLRPGSQDGLPFIGAHPDLAGLYVNSGHFRNGVLFAPAAGRLIADLILDRPSSLDPEPYRLAGRMAATT